MDYLKYQKTQKQPIKGTNYTQNKLLFGNYGLQICENGELTINQLLALKKNLALVFSKSKYWSALPQKFAKTSKTVGARMGSGKGLVFAYVYKIIKGSIILEWTSSYIAPQELTFFSLLPVKFKIIKKSL